MSRICCYNASFDSDSENDGDSDSDSPAYPELTSLDFISSMDRAHSRVREIRSKGTSLYEEDLEQLEANFQKLLISLQTIKDDDAEVCNTVQFAKRVLQDFVTMEYKIEKPHQLRVCTSDTAPVEYSLAVPSGWMLENENDWRDMAYNEVLSIRREHSHLLDKAFITRHGDEDVSASDVFRHLKCVNFLASSSEEFRLLSKKKCSKWVMKLTLSSQNQEEPYWRDEIYDKIQSYRQAFSYKLDEACRKVRETLTEERYGCLSFLQSAMQFLANSRADIALLLDKKDYCIKWLDDIKRFATDDESSVQAQEYKKLITTAETVESSDPTPENNFLTNWRDVAYDQVVRFRYHVLDVYLTNRKEWSERKDCRVDLKQLEWNLKRTSRLYEMWRAQMSFKSMDDYFKLVDRVDEHVIQIVVLTESMRRTVGGKHPRFMAQHLLMPKREKLSHLLNLSRNPL